MSEEIEKTSEEKDTPKKKSRFGKKKIIIALVVVGAVFVLLALIGSSNQPKKYTTDDLVPVKNEHATYSRPKQWQDASYADNLKQNFGLDVNNAQIYGEKIVKNKEGKDDIANAFVLFGKADNGKVDTSVLKSQEFRKKFEEQINSKLTAKNFETGICKNVTNFKMNYNYDYLNFPVSVAINMNCELSDNEKDNYNANSIELRLALVITNQGESYLYALVATDKSWSLNEPVYLQMLKDFQGTE